MKYCLLPFAPFILFPGEIIADHRHIQAFTLAELKKLCRQYPTIAKTFSHTAQKPVSGSVNSPRGSAGSAPLSHDTSAQSARGPRLKLTFHGAGKEKEDSEDKAASSGGEN